jgi:hypothetical protein
MQDQVPFLGEGLVAETPVRDRTADRLGFLPYADNLAIYINSPETDTPLTIAISGQWGSGKTSLALLLQDRLHHIYYWAKFWRERPITCWFNAWMHRDAEHLGAAFAAHVARQVSAERPWWSRLVSPLPTAMLSPDGRWSRRVWHGLVVVSVVLLGGFLLLQASPELRPNGSTLGRLFAHWGSTSAWIVALPVLVAILRKSLGVSESVGEFFDAPRSAASHGSLIDVREQLGRIIAQAQRRGPRGKTPRRRIVIFVDDLERCPPERALDVCEVSTQLLGHPDVVTVLVGDLDLVAYAAVKRYPEGAVEVGGPDFGTAYMQKIVQLRFNLPPLDRNNILKALLPDGSDGATAATYHSVSGSVLTRGRAGGPVRSMLFAVGAFIVSSIGAVAVNWFTSVDSLMQSGAAIVSVSSVVGLFVVVATVVLDSVRSTRRTARVDADLARFRRDGTGDKELARLVGYLDLSLRNAEVGYLFSRYVPSNMRRAKRLINHARLMVLIALGRGVFAGGSSVSLPHLVKWVVLSERWPRLAAAIAMRPDLMQELEDTDGNESIAGLVGGALAPGDELGSFLHEHPSLGSVAIGLVRLEPVYDTVDLVRPHTADRSQWRRAGDDELPDGLGPERVGAGAPQIQGGGRDDDRVARKMEISRDSAGRVHPDESDVENVGGHQAE